MFLGPTVLLYLLIGLGVAVAVLISGNDRGQPERWFSVAMALPFWPFYIPILLTRGRTASTKAGPEPERPPEDEMAAAIGRVDAELEAALNSQDGWAEDVLAREKGRIHELRQAWTAQSERIREMDRLLAGPGPVTLPEPAASAIAPETNERLRRSQQLRRENMERLRQVRRRAYDDLMATLAWVRELVSMIHLAKFTGAPAARAQELVAQIAAGVEGLSQPTWQHEAIQSAADFRRHDTSPTLQ